MATKIGDLYFEVTADTSGVQREVGNIGDAGSDAAKLISGALVDAFAAASIAAAAAASVIVFKIGEIGGAFNAAGQRATALFTALTGSLETATDTIAEFNALALSTPIFNTAQLQRTTSLLLTFGVAADDALRLAENINVAAIALDRGQTGAIALARAIGQIQGRGFLEGDEARQLSEVGVNAYAVIAEAVGLTTAEVIELGRQQKLLAEDVIPILSQGLEDTFGPVTQELLNTVGAQAQGITTIFTGLSSALVQPFVGLTGGGVLVEFLAKVREELEEVVVAAEDGTFRIGGALEGLNDLSAALAAGFEELGDSFINSLGGALEGGGFSDALSGLADRIPDLVTGFQTLTSGIAGFFRDLGSELEPLLPVVGRLAEILFDFGREALPIIAGALIDIARGVVPIAVELGEIANGFLELASPALLKILEALADAISLIADALEVMAPFIDDIVVGWVAWQAAIIIAEVATVSFITFAVNPLIIALGTLIATAALAVTAIAGVKSVARGISGDIDFLNEDVSIFEKPFQLAGRFGFALGGGDRSQQEFITNVDTAREAAAEFNLELLDGIDIREDVKTAALQHAAALGFEGDQAEFFANRLVVLKGELDAEIAALNRSQAAHLLAVNTDNDGIKAKDLLTQSTVNFNTEAEKEINLLSILKGEADAAWEALERLANVNVGSDIDDFLRDLPSIGEELTSILGMDDGVFRDLELSGLKDGLRESIVKVIQDLAQEGDLSLSEIRALFDERGLAGAIAELGTITREVTVTVDPLIKKYAELGAEAEDVERAIRSLNDARTERLRDQIDQLRSALDDAREAAQDARDALTNFLFGDYSATQNAVDDFLGSLESIGSDIEAGQLLGGVLGDAQIRQASDEFNRGISEIFQIGAEEGLSGSAIFDLLGPLLPAIDQIVSQGQNRISSLDFAEGITGSAGEVLRQVFGDVPGLIPEFDRLIAGIAGSDALVNSLESQIDSVSAELKTDVVFSTEQVQAALTKVTADGGTITILEPVVSNDAIALLFDEIEDLLNDDDLNLAVDEARITQQILDAAQTAEDSIKLDFIGGLEFDRAGLDAAAFTLGEDFARAFNQALVAVELERIARQFGDLDAELAGIRSNQSIPITSGSVPSVVFQNDITITETGSPRATASETVAAQAAAASSGGSLDLRAIYGTPSGGPR